MKNGNLESIFSRPKQSHQVFLQTPLFLKHIKDKDEDAVVIKAAHSSLMNIKIQESLKNKEDIKETRRKIKFLNEKVLNAKHKDFMRYVLHNGYWKYKKSHFVEPDQ